MSDSDGAAVLVEHDHPRLRVDAQAVRALVRQIVDAEGYVLGTVSVVLTDHDTVLALNRDYLGHDYHTDVLSFNLSEDAARVDGEIYVDLDTAAERHAEFEASFEEEARRYVAHGALHLVGYDDATPEARATMRRLEDQFLAALS